MKTEQKGGVRGTVILREQPRTGDLFARLEERIVDGIAYIRNGSKRLVGEKLKPTK